MLTGYTTTNVDWRSSEKTGSPGRYRPCFRGLKDRCITLMLREKEKLAIPTGAAPAISALTTRRVCCFSSEP